MTTGQLSVITGARPDVLGKVFTLKDGKLHKETAGPLSVGTYEVRSVSNAGDLISLLSSIGTNQCISSSIPMENLPQSGQLVSRKLKAEYPGAITRTKDDFGFRHGVPGVLALDYDPQPGDIPMRPDELWALLQDGIPDVQTAGVMHWLSGSSHIWHGDVELQGRRGQRVYILVADAGDIPRAAQVLADQLWLAGHGRVVLSKSGAKLLRHVFDDAMKEPARLDYCGGAVCKPPLSQRRGAPSILSDGGFLDTRVALPDLTAVDAAKVEAMKQNAKDLAEPAAAVARAAYVLARGSEITTRLVRDGVPVADAHERGQQAARSAVGGTLLGDFTVELENGKEVTIGQVLDDRDRYHGALCKDPLEPDYLGGKITGRFFLYGSAPLLHSFAHGGATYRLHRQPTRIYLQSGRKAETANQIRDRLADEPDIFLKAGVLVRLEAGRLIPIKRAAGLGYLVGTRFALFRRSADGRDVPVDLDDAVSNMILAAIGN
jgi:hypothetical protein